MKTGALEVLSCVVVPWFGVEFLCGSVMICNVVTDTNLQVFIFKCNNYDKKNSVNCFFTVVYKAEVLGK